jgi:hypothetical protein
MRSMGGRIIRAEEGGIGSVYARTYVRTYVRLGRYVSTKRRGCWIEKKCYSSTPASLDSSNPNLVRGVFLSNFGEIYFELLLQTFPPLFCLYPALAVPFPWYALDKFPGTEKEAFLLILGLAVPQLAFSCVDEIPSRNM